MLEDPRLEAQGRLTRFPNVDAVSKRGHALVGFRPSQPEEPQPNVVADADDGPGRWGLRLPSLRGRSALLPSLDRTTREERAEERERLKRQATAEAARQAFFETPVGRARLSYKRGHRLFQYEIEVSGLEPTVIPGPTGSPAQVTTDPVDILNAVTAEGWKLVTGKFIHSELRGGLIGCYLFKRSQKRRLPMNNPWQDPGTLS